MAKPLLPTAWCVCALLLWNCDDTKNDGGNPPEKAQITVTESLIFPEQGGWNVLSVKADGAWEASCDAQWLTLTPGRGYLDGEVTVTVRAGGGSWGREANVVFRSANTTAGSRIIQQGAYSEAKRIDAEGPANCYIASPATGFHTFEAAAKGNASDQPLTGVAAAKIVWQDHPELVHDVAYDPKTALIGFTTSGTPGNAVVAAVGGNGKILWSWHLWITGCDPDAAAFTTPANANDTQWRFMDRNLGALNATPGDTDALGLLYQWGRKDPFPGVGSVRGEERPLYDANGEALPAPPATAAGFGTQRLAVQHPDVFYKISYRTNDWTTPSDDDYWGGVSRRKTVWDPCPAGWRVPLCDRQGASPYGFLSTGNATWSEQPAGYLYDRWWLPCTGTRVYESGELSFNIKGPYGGMWIGTAGKANPDQQTYPALYGQYLFVIDGDFFGTGKDSRSQGMALRCVQE